MPRDTFDADLSVLHDALLELGERVLRAVELSMQALHDADEELATQVIDGDAEINRVRYELEERAIGLMAAQAPVASDLRRLVSTLAILNELERIGDHAEGVARINQLMGPEAAPRKLGYLPAMADRAEAMLADSMRAFANDDVGVAQHVCLADDDLDRLQDRVYADTFQGMIADPTQIQRNTYILWTAHNLERIGDRCTNICERVIYNVTGELDDLNVSRY
jgi:phosphate transport system protein